VGKREASVERIFTSALVSEALLGKSFLNFSNASIFWLGSLMRLASWYALASGAISREVAGVVSAAFS